MSSWKEERIRDVAIWDGYLLALTNNADGQDRPQKKDDRLLVISGLSSGKTKGDQPL